MTRYSAPLQDIDFVLHRLLGLRDSDIPGYGELTPDFTGAVLGEAGRLAAEVFHPLNASGDRQGCRLQDGRVHTPDGFAAAHAQLRAGGWLGLDLPAEFGGQGMPVVLNTAVGELFCSANMALNLYQGLSHGAATAILAHGSDAQKAEWLPKLISGEWAGTMNLTEPQAGTDLGLVRTRAAPQPDGSWRLDGEKIFISAGDHDLADNVLHLVLARAEGGGPGTAGLSLFAVPRLLDGAPNGVAVERLEAKMGLHGSATCAMRYEAARGWLLGPLHGGMAAMFTMMNEERLGVGLQGYAQAELALQNAAAYAAERLQGRVPGDRNAAGGDAARPADPIILHPDVRLMLMQQRAFVEGARALTLWVASLLDRARRLDDAGAEGLVGLLTPVVKAFLTDQGFQSCVLAQQVWGGHGYIEDNGMAQIVRDARISMIYEGTNGVQALDLVGRKLGQDGGRHALAFAALVQEQVERSAGEPRLQDFHHALAAALADLQAAAGWLLQEGVKQPAQALAGASDFLHLLGHVALGLMWSRMAGAALAGLEGAGPGTNGGTGPEGGAADRAFLQAKLATGRFHMARLLPATALHLARITSGAGPVMALEAEAF